MLNFVSAVNAADIFLQFFSLKYLTNAGKVEYNEIAYNFCKRAEEYREKIQINSMGTVKTAPERVELERKV